MKRSSQILLMAMMAGVIPQALSAAETMHEEAESGFELMGPELPSTLPHDATLELPEWKKEDTREIERNQAPVNLGGGLWPGELWPLMPLPDPLPSGGRYGEELLEGEGSERLPVEPVSKELYDIYFGSLPPEFVVDPQGLLDEIQQEELGRFIDQYAVKEAGMLVRVLLLGNQQKLPPEIGMQELTDQWFGSVPGAVVVYSFGRPRSSLCFFSTALQSSAGAEQLTAIREACVKEALVATSREEQLARYCIKMAVRLNRLQVESAGNGIDAHGNGSSKKHALSAKEWISIALFSLAGLLGGLTLLQYLRNRKATQPNPTWLLPDQEISTRLNAPHCGGTMAVVKFK
jgi:hypothetical protein